MDRISWDSAIEEADGSLLQSWRWGEYRRGQGWKIERLRVDGATGTTFAQILFRHIGPISLAHIPRGPVLAGNVQGVLPQLIGQVDDICRRHRAVSLVVERDRAAIPIGSPSLTGFVAGPPHLHPSRTVKVQLGSDEEMLARMHASTRAHIRRAERRGVTVEHATDDEENRATLYDLLNDTSRRNGFPIHPRAYYDDLLQLFESDAALMIARFEDEVVAGALAVRFGNEAVYLHGGSSTEHRGHGGAHYLQWSLMRWAREQGCGRYDMWGIATEGLYQFKIGFGGEVIEYPPTLERHYQPALAALVRMALAARYPIRAQLAKRRALRQR